MPRRFIAISSSTMIEANVASWCWTAGIAADAYCAAEEIDTATVST